MGNQALEKLKRIRRELHGYPEAGWTEFWTTAYVAEALEKMGYAPVVGAAVLDTEAIMGHPQEEELQKCMEEAQRHGAAPRWIDRMDGYTGALAVLDTGREGPVMAFRFDIDCVETQEARDSKHRPARENFTSVNPGRMHACGHDGHTAIGLVFAEWLQQNKDSLKGQYKLIFQPAEEGVRGAYAMTRQGVVDHVDYFFALHLGIHIPTGTLVAGTEGFLCTTKFDVFFTGKGAHAGGEPNEGRNALLGAASAALNLHAIAPHKDGISRINVGVLQAGEGRNVIAPKALMKVETRGSTDEVAQYMYARAEEVIRGAAQMYGLDYTISKVGEAITATSDQKLVELVSTAASKVKEVRELQKMESMKGSDDATWMMRHVQERGGVATYMLVGSDIPAGHHNDHFDLDENSLLIGFKVLVQIALETTK